jgi:hypothetical protein
MSLDTKKIYWIQKRDRDSDTWIEIDGPLEASAIDERVDDLCRRLPGVAFRKIEAEILED